MTHAALAKKLLVKPGSHILLVVLTVLALGCAKEGSLVGTWTASDPEGNSQTIIFRKDGTADWQLQGEGETRTFEGLRWTFEEEARPAHLDLAGIPYGPLQGQTLYCILDFPTHDSFRMDCAPGASDASGETVRPVAFDGDDTLTFSRAE